MMPVSLCALPSRDRCPYLIVTLNVQLDLLPRQSPNPARKHTLDMAVEQQEDSPKGHREVRT